MSALFLLQLKPLFLLQSIILNGLFKKKFIDLDSNSLIDIQTNLDIVTRFGTRKRCY